MVRCFSLLLAFSSILGSVSLHADAKLDFFESKIRPALIEHCYECHSHEAGKKKGGLYLDSRNGWQKGGDSGPSLVPGEPADSILLQAIAHSGEVPEMPPKEKLPPELVDVFKKWIADGAFDPREPPAALEEEEEGIDLEEGRKFWSFQPRKPIAGKQSIDDFIQPSSPPAPAEKLVRRVYYDLSGLPPTVEERNAFLAAHQNHPKQAIEALVDDLLSRSTFGEKWGRHWLDLARFAESNGGDINLTFREAWRYRNYVIDSFNRDMPYDQFVTEQLAGDLLPYDSIEQRNRQLIATGFLLIGPKMLSERNKEKMHFDIVDEQLDTVGRTFMGLTMGCARCHDHKFDPIPTSDYYAMAGIFRSSVTAHGIRMNNVNVSGWHETDLALAGEEAEKYAKAKADIESLEEKIKIQQKLIKDYKAKGFKRALIGTVVDDLDAQLFGKWRKSTYRPEYIGSNYLSNDKTDQESTYIIWKTDLEKPGNYEVRLGCGFGNGIDKRVPIVIKHDGGETELFLDQSKPGKIDDFWHVLGNFKITNGKGEVALYTRGTSEYVLADAVQFIHEEDLNSEPQPDDEETALLTRAENDLKQYEKDLKTRQTQIKKRPKAMATRDREVGKISDVAIRIRGEVKNRGATVPRGFLQVVSFGNEENYTIPGESSGRLELAKWLTDPDHPLTSRVMVNRLWQHLFGNGIVRTSDNFGKLGDVPSHPELLDWLAAEFIESDWSIKSMIRRMMLSDTYQQVAINQSKPADPENRRWQYQNRRPLSAESIRDSMLSISGTLNRKKVGYALDGVSDQAIANSASQSGGKNDIDINRHRSIYLPMLRNAMPKVLEIFDMANPDMVTGQRPRTSVPAQALYLLNSPFVMDMASATSERFMNESDDIKSAIENIYLAIFSRRVESAELSLALEYMESLQSEENLSEKEALASFVQTLFSSTEFRFLD